MIPLIESLEAAIAFYAENPSGACMCRYLGVDRECYSLEYATEFFAVCPPDDGPNGPGLAKIQVELIPRIKPYGR